MIGLFIKKNLIVASNDDDANSGISTFLDGVDHFLPRRIQHSNESNKSAVGLHGQLTKLLN